MSRSKACWPVSNIIMENFSRKTLVLARGWRRSVEAGNPGKTGWDQPLGRALPPQARRDVRFPGFAAGRRRSTRQGAGGLRPGTRAGRGTIRQQSERWQDCPRIGSVPRRYGDCLAERRSVERGTRGVRSIEECDRSDGGDTPDSSGRHPRSRLDRHVERYSLMRIAQG